MAFIRILSCSKPPINFDNVIPAGTKPEFFEFFRKFRLFSFSKSLDRSAMQEIAEFIFRGSIIVIFWIVDQAVGKEHILELLLLVVSPNSHFLLRFTESSHANFINFRGSINFLSAYQFRSKLRPFAWSIRSKIPYIHPSILLRKRSQGVIDLQCALSSILSINWCFAMPRSKRCVLSNLVYRCMVDFSSAWSIWNLVLKLISFRY